jgi:hypothetical protein
MYPIAASGTRYSVMPVILQLLQDCRTDIPMDPTKHSPVLLKLAPSLFPFILPPLGKMPSVRVTTENSPLISATVALAIWA